MPWVVKNFLTWKKWDPKKDPTGGHDRSLSRSLFEIIAAVTGRFLVQSYGHKYGINLPKAGFYVFFLSKNICVLGMSQHLISLGAKEMMDAARAKNLAKCVQQIALILLGYLITTPAFTRLAAKVIDIGAKPIERLLRHFS